MLTLVVELDIIMLVQVFIYIHSLRMSKKKFPRVLSTYNVGGQQMFLRVFSTYHVGEQQMFLRVLSTYHACE